MSSNNANQQLNNLLISKNFDPQSLDAQGKPAANPEDAVMFNFDYTAESGKDYGTVVMMIDDNNNLNVYFGDNLGKGMEGDDKKGWFDFLFQIRQFAKRNMMTFSLQNLNKLKYSMQGQAALAEGWTGRKNVSWNAAPTEARLMIKHKKNLGETDARFRYIESLFIETTDGERYKMPFKSLSAGKAMLEHVRQGGKPYDVRGNHITTIVEEMSLLSRFRKANQGRIFEGETQQLVEEATTYYETLKHNLKSLTTKTGYKKYFEAWSPAAITDEDVIIEDLRHLFVEQNIDSRVEQALPLLAKLKQEHAMKEINVFESMMNLITEGTWALPDTPQKQQELIKLLADELPVGADATNATELLYDILGDDELFDKLNALARQDANADAREIIINRLEQLKDNPDVAQVIGKIKMSTNTQAQPQAAEQPAGEELKEFAPGAGGGDEEQLRKLAKQWSDAGEDYDAQEDAEEALAKFGYGISEIEDGSGDIQLIPTGEYMLDWNDNDIIVFQPEELSESCHTCRKPVCECSLHEGAGDVMFKDQDKLDRLERLRDLARRMGNTEKFELLDKEVKAIYQANPVGMREEEIAEGPEADQEAVRELVLTAYNNSDLYRQSYEPIIKNLQKKVAKGVYDTEMAKKLWGYHADRAAQAYAKDFGGVWNKMFSPADRRAAAEQFEQEAREEIGADEAVSEASDTVEFGPDGKPLAWSHESDWEKIKKRNGKEVDPRGEVTHMSDVERRKAEKLDELSPETLKSYIKKAGSSGGENSAPNLASRAAHKLATDTEDDGEADDHKAYMRSKGIGRAVDRLEESGMAEADLLLQEIARGNVDIYAIYANPKSNIEKFVSDQIHDKVEQLTTERPELRHEADIDKVLEIIRMDLADDYGVDESVGGGNWLEESGDRTPLAGQYGHSGKLQTVEGLDQDMMDRIKFLAGLTK